jgi:hypothetical protein
VSYSLFASCIVKRYKVSSRPAFRNIIRPRVVGNSEVELDVARSASDVPSPKTDNFAHLGTFIRSSPTVNLAPACLDDGLMYRIASLRSASAKSAQIEISQRRSPLPGSVNWQAEAEWEVLSHELADLIGHFGCEPSVFSTNSFPY